MPRTTNKMKTKETNPDYVRMYYEHQYDRIKRHFGLLLLFTLNIVGVSTI